MSLPDARRAHLAAAIPAAIVAAVAALVFVPALTGEFVWDDVPLIVGNARIRSPDSVVELLATPFWDISSDTDVAPIYARIHRPWVKLAYHLQFLAFGEDPLGFHAINLLLHALCVWLVWDALRARLARSDLAGVLAASAGAALFALHPTRAESVAWISGSTDLWMALFVLLGVRVLRDAERPAALALGAVLLALAGFSKEPALLAPLLVLGDGLARGDARRALIRRTAAAGLASAIVVVVIALVVPSDAGEIAVGFDALRVLATLGHYLELVVWPVPSSVFPALLERGEDGSAILHPLAIALGALALAGIAALATLAARRPALRPWLADVLWLVVPLAPLLNVLVRSSDSLASDRFLYLPLFGVCALLARALAPVLAREDGARAIALTAAGIVLVASGSAAMASASRFESARALWSHEIEIHPDRPSPYAHLVAALRVERAYEEAAEVALAAASIARAQGNHDVEARFLLMWAMTRLDSISDAEQEELVALRAMYDGFAEAPRLALDAPAIGFEVAVSPAGHATLRDDVALVLAPRASAHLRTGSLERAEALLGELVREHPRVPGPWNLLTVLRARRGDFDGALEASSAAERIFPGSPAIRGAREAVSRARARAAQPVASELEARVRDAEVQMLLGAPEAARRLIDPVLATRPTDHALVRLRAQIDVSDRRFDLAREGIERARAQAPGDPFFVAALAGIAAAEAQAASRE